ncbi:hypothetical protein JCM8115_004126 [Rhodotorula mucilaginosa]
MTPSPELPTLAAWISLVSEAASKAGKSRDALQDEVLDCLVDLLAVSVEPSTALRAYLAAAIESQGGQRLCPPGVLARKVVQRPTSSPFVTDFCLQAVNRALASDATSPSFGTSTTEERTAGLDAVIRTVLPNVLKSPTSSSASQRWLVRLVRRAMQSSKQNTSDKVTVEKVREGLRAVLAQLDGTETGVLGELKNELQELLARSSPRARKRTPAPVKIDDFDLSRRGVDPDAALYCADLLLHPHTPTSLVTSRFLGLLRYRTDQATFRGSTAEQAASLLLAEVVGAMVWSLHSATRHDFLLESLVCAKLPQALKACREAAPQHLSHAVLTKALEVVRSGLESSPKAEKAQADDASTQHIWDHLVFALCREGLLSSAESTTLVPSAESVDLEPPMETDLDEKLASTDSNELRAAVEEHMHTFSSQNRMSQAMAAAFRHRSENADITGLANLCEVVMSHKDELAVMFLHIEPHELLRPVRELLDARDPSQDDANDSSVMERYGMLVLFLQVTVERFELSHDLAKHLGSTSSFFVAWLRASSAVYTLTNISDEERHTISGWIGALFGEGISDELMHSTNPKVLLKIAPTILKQSLMACRAAVVDQDSLRDALSYFLQELLRFTLPGVLVWLLTEIEQTSAASSKTGMINILQFFCHSDALPPPVLELIAPHLAIALRRGSLSGLSISERLKLLKLIAPYRPQQSPLTWSESPTPPAPAVLDPARVPDQTSGPAPPFALTTEHLDAAVGLRATSAESIRDSLRRIVDQVRREDSTDPTQPDHLVRYGRLERAGVALAAWQPSALQELVRSAASMHRDEDRQGTVDKPSSHSMALIADILGGSLTLADEADRQEQLRVISTSVRERGSRSGAASELWERLQSWPAVSSEVVNPGS